MSKDRVEELRRKYKPYIEPGIIFPMGQASQAKIKMDVCELISKIEQLETQNERLTKQFVDSNAVEGSNQKRYERAEAEIKQLKKHMPDNCAAGICGNEDQITAGDAVAMALNDVSEKYARFCSDDAYYDLAIILGHYVERAMSGATHSRQKEIGELHEALELLLKAQGPLVCGNHVDETHTLGCVGCECDVCNERQDAVLKAEVLSV